MLLIIHRTSARFYHDVAVREAIFAEIGSLVGYQGTGHIKDHPRKVKRRETYILGHCPRHWHIAVLCHFGIQRDAYGVQQDRARTG